MLKSFQRGFEMEVTIKLPEKVYANLSNVADKSHRPIDELIVERLENDFAIDTEDLEKQIAVCSDAEVLELAKVEMPFEEDKHLSSLLNKQNEGILSEAEQKELWRLMDLNKLTTLKKAFALCKLTRRGLNGDNQ